MVVLFPVRDFGFLGLFQVGRLEGVDAAIAIIAGRRLGIRIAEFHGETSREVDFQNFLQTDTSVEIGVIEPEVAGCHRLVNGPVKMRF